MARALSLAKVFERLDYSPHKVQKLVHTAHQDHRFVTVCAGRRTGKSVLGGHRLTIEALRAAHRQSELEPHGRRAEFWIVGPEYSDAEKEFRVLYNDLTKLGAPFDRPGTYNDPIGGNMHISLYGGRFQVHAKSAKYPDTLVGEALEGVILAEAAKLKPSIWTKYIRPMLSDYRGWGMMTSTPEGKNWFYEQHKRGQSDDPGDNDWWSIRMPSWSNPYLFPMGEFDPEIEDMRRDMAEEKFKQEIGAEFTEFVGRVFKNYDPDINLGSHPYNPRYPLVVATDYGYTNPNVVLFIQWDTFDNVWVCAEYYRSGRTPEELLRDLENDDRLRPLMYAATEIYPDPEDPGTTNMLANKFRLKIVGSTGGSLKDRLDLIRRWLKAQPEELKDDDPLKRPKLHVDKSCTMLDKEMQDYRYPETKEEANSEAKEAPIKKDDHAPEALTRFFGGKYGRVMKERGRSRVSKAQVSRRG
mgnify:CR=1 FL=1